MSGPSTPRMPVAVIDNTLLSRLNFLDLTEKLTFVFKQIRIPPEVRKEAYRGPNRKELKNLLEASGGFFVFCKEFDPNNKAVLETMPGIDKGEAAAIAQAEATGAALISDDASCYKQARVREIPVYRTGQILCLLKERGQLGKRSRDNCVTPYLAILIESRFHTSKGMIVDVLAQADELESLPDLLELRERRLNR